MNNTKIPEPYKWLILGGVALFMGTMVYLSGFWANETQRLVQAASTPVDTSDSSADDSIGTEQAIDQAAADSQETDAISNAQQNLDVAAQ